MVGDYGLAPVCGTCISTVADMGPAYAAAVGAAGATALREGVRRVRGVRPDKTTVAEGAESSAGGHVPSPTEGSDDERHGGGPEQRHARVRGGVVQQPLGS
jgi:hypothetical protein